MTDMKDLLISIVREQSQIIGAKVAKVSATQTGLIEFRTDTEDSLELKGEPEEALDKLIQSYRTIFGEASVDVCIEVISRYPLGDLEQFLPDYVRKALGKANK